MLVTVVSAACYTACVSAQSAQLVSEPVYKAVVQAEELMAAGNGTAALEDLESLAQSASISEHERALIHQMAAVIYADAGDFNRAAEYFEAVLAGKSLPENVTNQTRYNLAQIYVQQERYREALHVLQPDIAGPKLTPDKAFLLASIFAALDQLEEALQWAEQSLSLRESGDPPPEPYLKLAASLNISLRHYPRAAALLEVMVERFPMRALYWRQLASIHLELGQADALSVLVLGRLQGVLSEGRDLRQLAMLYLRHGLPYKAAVLLETAVADGTLERDRRVYELLASAWHEAREHERAIAPLKKAASLSDNGRLFLRLAHLYAEKEAWQDALKSVHRALQQGGLKNRSAACLLKGIVQSQLHQFDEAERTFLACLEFEETYRQATRWLEWLSREKLSRSAEAS